MGAAGLALVGVLAISAALVSADPGVLAMVVVLGAGLVCQGGFPWRRALRLIARMKWFYLSLLVFYGLWPTTSGDGFAGLLEAGWRIVALMLVAALVVWLTERFSRLVLVRSLGILLGGPRQAFGDWGECFARRLFLALAYFEAERSRVESRRASLRGSRRARLHEVCEWLVQRVDGALSGDWDAPMTMREEREVVDDRRIPRGALIWLWIGVVGVWVVWLAF